MGLSQRQSLPETGASQGLEQILQLYLHGRDVVLSYTLGLRRFAADPSIVGKTVDLSGEPYVIIGVTAPDYRTDPVVDAWVAVASLIRIVRIAQTPPVQPLRHYQISSARRFKSGADSR